MGAVAARASVLRGGSGWVAAGGMLRSSAFDVTAVVVDEELVEVESGDTTARRFAIAYDLGTTTVVATLLDLDSGQPVAVRSMRAN